MKPRGPSTRGVSKGPLPLPRTHGHWRRMALLGAALILGGTLCYADEADPAGPAGEAGASEQDATYSIGVGDVLDVHIYEEDAREECVVRPDGRITLPLIGDVEAAGASPPELADRIAAQLAPFQESPTVTVAVREIHSYRVYVLGEVADQQMIESNTPLRLLEALAIAGGFNEFADREIMVLRGSGEETRRLQIDYESIVDGETPEDNLLLRSGDVVVVR